MFFEFVRLQTLKGVRSVSLKRNIVGGLFLAFIAFALLSSLLILALALETILENIPEAGNPVIFLNNNLLYFFLIELLYRFFLQKLPVIDMENFLHLPIKRSQIVHFLLGRSLFTSLSVIALICFTPFSISAILPVYSVAGATGWLATIVLISGTLHWLILWYKQQFGDHPAGIISLLLFTFSTIGAHYYGYFSLGERAAPFFDWSLVSPVPAVLAAVAFVLAYLLAYSFYRKHAYIEELGEKRNISYVNRSFDFFSRFGLAGEMADLEWKLILRHKKSRSYLLITFLFLLYGLFFYGDAEYTAEVGFSYLYIFLGIFITGIFLMQYGQLFLSWNSAYFDFYLSRKDGIRSLVKGKYLLFFVISLLCFILSIPYVYFGWDVLLVHIASFLFNMGVSIHMIVYMSLWKPKPMNLDKGAIFNYEGVGIVQFLMGIPLIGLPYLIFIPSALLVGDYFGLAVLGGLGVAGMIYHDRLSDVCIQKLVNTRHEISTSFRQET